MLSYSRSSYFNCSILFVVIILNAAFVVSLAGSGEWFEVTEFSEKNFFKKFLEKSVRTDNWPDVFRFDFWHSFASNC